MNQYIFILGREKEIAYAELCSILEPNNLTLLDQSNIAIYQNSDLPEKIIDRLGGTIKIGKILGIIDLFNLAKIKNLITEIIQKEHLDNTKMNFGLSYYGAITRFSKINKLGFEIKNKLKKQFNIRFIQNQEKELNAATIINNNLTKLGNLELLLISGDKEQIFLGKTIQVQNINNYSKRDFDRPNRDSRVGMLPPKLAQIIINLALYRLKNKKNLTVLDPFCGTGVVLQEAKLMNLNTIGSDIDKKMIQYTKNNLKWLVNRFALENLTTSKFIVGDARKLNWPKFDLIASEIYLGNPLQGKVSINQVNEIKIEIESLLKDFLTNLYPQISQKITICLAIPVWNINGKNLEYLPIVDQLKNLGYNLISCKGINPQKLIYIRSNQTVGRQLILLEKE
ncbi:MAG: methyltransferase domain-containing protein [Patescibacteria group bacterium]|jgi:tRNA (guanine10-N2)-dimethyltransferase|nr:methyltransferase domain-containing protein [Patescibacteria group bacterium]